MLVTLYWDEDSTEHVPLVVVHTVPIVNYEGIVISS